MILGRREEEEEEEEEEREGEREVGLSVYLFCREAESG